MNGPNLSKSSVKFSIASQCIKFAALTKNEMRGGTVLTD